MGSHIKWNTFSMQCILAMCTVASFSCDLSLGHAALHDAVYVIPPAKAHFLFGRMHVLGLSLTDLLTLSMHSGVSAGHLRYGGMHLQCVLLLLSECSLATVKPRGPLYQMGSPVLAHEGQLIWPLLTVFFPSLLKSWMPDLHLYSVIFCIPL